MSFWSRHQFGRAVFAALIGFTVVAAPATVRAADDDEDKDLFDQKILRHIMTGLGFKRDEKQIEYRERSPLVLPPSKQLRTPEAANAGKAAGWPDDPDAKKARQLRDIEKNRRAYVEGVDDRPLLPNQYAIPGRTQSDANPASQSTDITSRPSTVQELGSKSIFSKVWGGDKNDYVPFTGEPPRASLLEPPVGYRTPSPAQPYGVGKEKWVAPVIDRQVPVR